MAAFSPSKAALAVDLLKNFSPTILIRNVCSLKETMSLSCILLSPVEGEGIAGRSVGNENP